MTQLSARQAGRSTVHAGVKRMEKVAPRPHRNPRIAWDDATVDRIRKCAEAGMTRLQASEATGVPYPSLYTLGKKHHMVFREAVNAYGLPENKRKKAKKPAAVQVTPVMTLEQHYRGMARSLRW